jgi:hypothetical protein
LGRSDHNCPIRNEIILGNDDAVRKHHAQASAPADAVAVELCTHDWDLNGFRCIGTHGAYAHVGASETQYLTVASQA